MLHKLVNNGEELWPNDPEKRSIIYEKYKQYQVPVNILFSSFSISFISISNIQKEEFDWVGLLPDEALEKFEKEEDEKYEQSIRPWKEIFRESLIAELSRRQRNNEPIDITPVTAKPYDIYFSFFFLLFFFFYFRKPKTLKEKVINKLWGS